MLNSGRAYSENQEPDPCYVAYLLGGNNFGSSGREHAVLGLFGRGERELFNGLSFENFEWVHAEILRLKIWGHLLGGSRVGT